jgi:hyperosmotically inducible protein
MHRIKRSLFLLCYLLAAIVIGGCAGLFKDEGVKEEPRNDVIVAMRVKADLIKTPELGAAAIHVEASDGVVHLTGFVEEATQRQLASTVAQRISGVRQVKNDIEIK